MNRVALQPFQFSDGTKVPKGAYLMVSGMAAHLDPENYSDPSTFDPWRFISNEGKGSSKPSIVLSDQDSDEYCASYIDRA